MSTSADEANHSASSVGNKVLIKEAEIWSSLEDFDDVESMHLWQLFFAVAVKKTKAVAFFPI
jgi:hypothetical protein